jgi:hypothetical protein
VRAKKRIKGFFRGTETLPGAFALATPRRIKASHRRRRRVASDHLLYILNNPLSGTDPTGYCSAEVGTRIKKCETITVTGTNKDGSTESRSVRVNVGTLSAISSGGGNGGSNRQSPTSENRNGSGGGIASQIKGAIGRAFVPNAQDLQSRGEPGSDLDDTIGFGKGLLNSGIGLINSAINSAPLVGIYNRLSPNDQIGIPEVPIENKELLGAFASNLGTLVVSALTPVAARGGVAEAGAPSMRRPAVGAGAQDVANKVGDLKYSPRVRARGVEDPKSHNFPYSFDREILSTKPIPKPNGYNIYQMEGTMTGKVVTDLKTGIRTQQIKEGFFEIGVTKDGVIDHRFFRPSN